MATSNRHKGLPKVHQLSLTAAALQDHIACNNGLVTSGISLKRRRVNVQPAAAARTSARRDNLYCDQEPSSLTLAQRLGLVDRPPPPLTQYQWESIMVTSSERGDSEQPCPICHDDFKLKPQVLLSCSHTFHKSCLLAFERFSGKKQCPLCRHQEYETRVIKMASEVYKEKAAIRIQAVWRGYKVRKWYTEYRDLHPPIHPVLKKKYYERRLSKVTDKMVEESEGTANILDGFFASIDDNVKHSRQIMSRVDPAVKDGIPWSSIKEKAKLYISSPCAVCLSDMNDSTSSRPLSFLSCTHVFHTSCISSLEMYSQQTMSSINQPYLCPICRDTYIRKDY